MCESKSISILNRFETLEEVNLSANGITGNGLKAFDGVLQSNFSLKTLDLSGNPIGDEGAKVAGELVAEFSDPNLSLSSPDQVCHRKSKNMMEKNIRRRVYDALNVLMSMDIISKDKKEIQWRGLPQTSLSDIEALKSERLGLKCRVDKKTAYLQELEDQFEGLQNLIQRNEQLYSSGDAPNGGLALPFILVQTRPHATVEVEISEDMQLVHFHFNRFKWYVKTGKKS